MSLRVDAPAEVVWQVLTDLDRWPEVMSGVVRVEQDGEGPLREGTTWRETRRGGGREETQEMTVVAVDEGRSFTAEASAHGTRYASTTRVEPRGDACELSTTFSGEPGTGRARVVATLTRGIALPFVRRALLKDLHDVARDAERSHRAG